MDMNLKFFEGDTVTLTFPDGRKLVMTPNGILLVAKCGIGVQLDADGFRWVNTLMPDELSTKATLEALFPEK